MPPLSPLGLVANENSLSQLILALAIEPIVAVDTESNSLHAYRECICLIQFSTPTVDYILDPSELPDLGALAPFFANPDQEKVFHAAENDILSLRRDHHFEFVNIFDTMTAARTLGWPQFGLAAILDTYFGVKMNKKYQRADWRHRPLSPEQLDYARLDTHYLIALRNKQFQALTKSGYLAEAQEEFARLARLNGDPETATPDIPAFWRVKGARDLPPQKAAVLEALFAYREQLAERLDRPPFKVMREETLMELTRLAPRRAEDLHSTTGMTPELMRRHAQGVLQAIENGLQAPAKRAPQAARESDDVRDRYDRLHTWRKERAKARGVESDVIIPRTALLELARRAPSTYTELAQIADLGPWRRDTYGKEILALLSRAASPQRHS